MGNSKEEVISYFDGLLEKLQIEHRTIYFSCQRIYEVPDPDIKIYKAINEVNQCALSGVKRTKE